MSSKILSYEHEPKELDTIGEEISVRINYFPVTGFPRAGFVFEYDIEIKNDKILSIPREYRRAVYMTWLKRFQQQNPDLNPYKIVFDNKKIILTYDQLLPGIDKNGITEIIIGPSRMNVYTEYKVSIKQAGQPVDLSLLRNLYETRSVNMQPDDLQNIKQIFSIVLHENCSFHAEFILNRSFFSHPSSKNQLGFWNLGLGKAIWQGFYSCLVFTKGAHQLLMNLDISHQVFMMKKSFLDFLCDVMFQCPSYRKRYRPTRNSCKANLTEVLELLDPNLNDQYHLDIEFFLKNCRNVAVQSQLTQKPMTYIIHGLGESATKQTFYLKEKNTTITVENYFKGKYGKSLEYPMLPTLSTSKNAFLPMEYVDIKPARIVKLTEDQRATLCTVSSLKPSACFRSINEIRQNKNQQCFEQDPFVQAWKLNVDVQMLTVSARVLPPPTIVYNSRFQITADNMRTPGVYDSRRIRFHKPTLIPSVWALINLSSMTEEECREFSYALSNLAESRGIRFPEYIYAKYDIQANSIDQMFDMLRRMFRRNSDCKFCIVILPSDKRLGDQAYADLKKLFELEFDFGIISQMIRENNVRITSKGRDAKLDGILLKINTKLNGINSILKVHNVIEQFFSKGHRIMYVGIDLSHPSPGSADRRSVVAVVASADDIPNRYFKEVYIQDRSPLIRKESVETIVQMKEIMKSLISQYNNYHNYPPKAIVIYRDGISNSEYNTVFGKELRATREACVELSPVYQPALTYIIVNKRHHTKCFPTHSEGNIPAGTAIDSTDVISPFTYNFLLKSHDVDKNKQARVPRYHVLYDDNHLKADEIKMLTNALCYTYARCTRSISIPAPVKYADLLATRGRFYLSEDNPIETQLATSPLIVSTQIRLSPQLACDSPFFV